jgi:hypothetical protein
MIVSLEFAFELRERIQARPLELTDPAFRNLVDGHWIDEMKFLPASTPPRHEIGLREDR